MAANQVEGQSGTALVQVPNLAIGHQTQLHQRLEAVADAQHQAVPVPEQVVDRVLEPLTAQEGGDELAGALRLVAAGEAAGQDNHLGGANGPLQRLGGVLQQLGAQVAHHHDFRVDARPQTGVGGIVLAVRAREHGDDRLGPGQLAGRGVGGAAGAVHIRNDLLLRLGVGGIDALQSALPGSAQLLQGNALAAHGEALLRRGHAQLLAEVRVLRQLGHDCAVFLPEQGSIVQRFALREADAVAEAHLHQALRHAAQAHRPGRLHLARQHQRMVVGPHGFQALVVGGIGLKEVDGVPGLLELAGDDVLPALRGDGEADQRGRHVQVHKGAGHGVLAADGGVAQGGLSPIGTQQGGEGLAPALRLIAQALEVLLKGQIDLALVRTGGHDLGHGLHHGALSAQEGAALHQIGVKARRHDGAGAGAAARSHGNQAHHGLGGGELVLAAVGEEHAARADGGVEALAQTPLGGGVGVLGDAQQLRPDALALHGLLAGQDRHADGGVLLRAVGVEELPAQAGDGPAVPAQNHPGLLGHLCDDISLQILRGGGGDELFRVLRPDHHGHALLALGDGKLGAVQALVLLAHGVEVDVQPVGQLADCHADAARAEVVAAANHAGHVAVAEEALELALLGGVALLHLAAHGLEGVQVVGLGGAGGAADAVPAGAAAQQDNHIPGLGGLPNHGIRLHRAHDRAQLHVLRHIAGVVELGDHAGGQANLVAVGGVARGGGGGQLALGQTALNGLAHGRAGVAAAGDAHGLVDVSTAREGVPDGAADAGGRAAEGLDLRGMVMGFVLELEQPVLLGAVHVHGNVNGTGVDFLALVDVFQPAPLLEHLCALGGDVHQGDGPLRGLLGAVDLRLVPQILLIGGLHARVLQLRRVDAGGEGGVAAVVGPVGVHHANLSDGGVALLVLAEIVLQKLQIVQIHGQTHGREQVLQGLLVHGGEAGDRGHLGGHLVALHQGFGLVHGRLPALHGVDEVAAHLIQLRRADGGQEDVHRGGLHQGAVHPGQQLHALGAGVGALVKLAGQGFHGQQGAVRGQGGQLLLVEVVHHRLGEDGVLGALVHLRVNLVHIVTVEDAQALQLQAQLLPQLSEQVAGLHVEAGALFSVASKNLVHSLFSFCEVMNLVKMG